jgi:starch-binding outer membrane protein, SusD/RagB family
MKKYFLQYIICCFIILGLPACSKLDQTPVDRLSDETIWKDPKLIQLYVADIYANLGIGFDLLSDDTSPLACITDEARGSYSWLGANSNVINGAFSSVDAPLNNWTNAYKSIRKANIFFKKIVDVKMADADKNNLIGQVKFLRAFYYFELVKRFGGVPLITEPQSLESDLMVKRATEADTYTFITKELEDAANLLPTGAPGGLASKWAAKALQGRVLLYAQQWPAAAAASLEVIEKGGYNLSNDYAGLFTTKQHPSEESIFEIQYVDPARTSSYDGINVPYFDNPGNYTSCTLPTQEMVDDYEMQATGLAISAPGSGYHPDNPYQGRDPRFYASILFEGASWKGRTIQTRVDGTDGIVDRNSNEDRTKTGYYVRKYLDEKLPLEKIFNSTQSWVELRLAEVMLNYAEAVNEAEGPAKAKTYIDKIRQRAGMPVVSDGLSKEAMRNLIRHERKIELAFENHRYWDLRRWRMAKDVLNGKVFHGMKITLNNGVYKYERVEADLGASSPRVFTDKYYYLPIPKGEIEKNPNLTQNKDWN